jgi:hypothetical protein
LRKLPWIYYRKIESENNGSLRDIMDKTRDSNTCLTCSKGGNRENVEVAILEKIAAENFWH